MMKLNKGLIFPNSIMLSEEGSFANFTFLNRLPSILQQIIKNNNFPSEVVNRLINLSDELTRGVIRDLNDSGIDISAWNQQLNPFLGKRWIDLPFLFAEMYFYRRIIEAINYFEMPLEERLDPYSTLKIDSLRKVVSKEQQLPYIEESLPRDMFLNSVYASLWGNRDDLSQLLEAQFQEEKRSSLDQKNTKIIANDADLIESKFLHRLNTRIDLIADNCGSELLRDLYLIDHLLSQEITGVVKLHLKWHPTFVSDATVRDLRITLDYLDKQSSEPLQSLSSRLREYMNSQRLHICEDHFWTMPLYFWEMNKELYDDLSKADLVFIKGDANYRRLVGDLHWAYTEPFDIIVSYFPASLVILRALKSELVVGLQPGQAEALQAEDPKWLTNGCWGVIQSQLTRWL